MASITTPNPLQYGVMVTDVDLATYRQAILDLTAGQGGTTGTAYNNPQAIDVSYSGSTSQARGWTTLAFGSQDYIQGTTTAMVSNGVTIATGGRYMVSAMVIWSANSTYARGIGFGPAGGGPGNYQLVSWNAGAEASTVALTQEIAVTAGTTLSLFGYQSTSANLSATFRRMSVRQVA